MNRTAFYNRLDETLSGIRADGLWKHEHEIDSPQSGEISLGEAGTRITVSYTHLTLPTICRV